MGKQYHPLDLDAAIQRVIVCARRAVEACDDDLPHDEIGCLGDSVMWLDIVKNNRATLSEEEGDG